MSNSNIVKLPGAAKRKIQQSANTADRREFRQSNPWPGHHALPIERDSARFSTLTRSPEMLLILAILDTLPPKQFSAVKSKVFGVAFHEGGEEAHAAYELISAMRKTEI